MTWHAVSDLLLGLALITLVIFSVKDGADIRGLKGDISELQASVQACEERAAETQAR